MTIAFQSTHSRGVRPITTMPDHQLMQFQSTHSRGVRHAHGTGYNRPEDISIHALTRSATYVCVVSVAPDAIISIHALTRSATLMRELTSLGDTRISIHALTRSATHSCVHGPRMARLFQSTHSRGVRRRFAATESQKWKISIHALTRSATAFVCDKFLVLTHFNPRTHEECDGSVAINEILFCNFNPRTHEECDRSEKVMYRPSVRFQSTHSRGVRRRHNRL